MSETLEELQVELEKVRAVQDAFTSIVAAGDKRPVLENIGSPNWQTVSRYLIDKAIDLEDLISEADDDG